MIDHIAAKIFTDDNEMQADFNALPWFVNATDEDIAFLAETEFDGYEVDEIVLREEVSNGIDAEDLRRVLRYVDQLENTPSETGFRVVLDTDSILEWVFSTRPHLLRIVL